MQTEFLTCMIPLIDCRIDFASTLSVLKKTPPILKKCCYLSGWQAFVVVSWLNTTSNSRACKWLQSTVCKFFFHWVGRDFSFHTSFTTCRSDSTKSPRRLKTVNGKEKLPFSLGCFFPLLLALQGGSVLCLSLLATLVELQVIVYGQGVWWKSLQAL